MECMDYHNVPGYDNMAATSDGDIYVNGKKLKESYANNGYCVVHYNNQTLTVHRLVAKSFYGEPKEKLDVNHIDGNKHNNNSNNLEWCTRQENILHAYRTGLNSQKNTFRIPLRKKVVGIDLYGRMYLYNSITIAKKEVNAQNIDKVLSGER